jgi:hypothetical protein
MRYRIKTNDWVCMGGCSTIIPDEVALVNALAEKNLVKPDPAPETKGAEEVRFENMVFEKK